MPSLFTYLQKMFETIFGQLLIPFDIVGITTKVTAENFNALKHLRKNTCLEIPQAQVTMVFSMMFP